MGAGLPGSARTPPRVRAEFQASQEGTRAPEAASKRGRFAETAIGYVHIDPCEPRLAEGKLFMFLAIDRVTKFAHAALLGGVVEAFPYAIHTVLTDNGMACADLPKDRGRNAVERLINGLKRSRRVATRCDTLAASRLATVTLAAIRTWARFEPAA